MKNITSFRVENIILYRDIDKLTKQVFDADFDRVYLECHGFDNVFTPREKCILKNVRFYSCQECFDDKDKTVKLFFYFSSIPLVQNIETKLNII